MEKKISISVFHMLNDVYDKIMFLQKKNELLISSELLKSLESSDRYIYYLAYVNDSLAGFMILKDAVDIIELEYILVDIDYRKQNIGSILVEKINDYIKEKGMNKIMLEVRKSNINAIKFYEKNGFTFTIERLNYYKEPVEDALIYEKLV